AQHRGIWPVAQGFGRVVARVEDEGHAELFEPPANAARVVTAEPQIDHRRRQRGMLGHVQRLAQLAGADYPGPRTMQLLFQLQRDERLFLDNEDRAPAERKSVHETTPCWDERTLAHSRPAGL